MVYKRWWDAKSNASKKSRSRFIIKLGTNVVDNISSVPFASFISYVKPIHIITFQKGWQFFFLDKVGTRVPIGQSPHSLYA